jgi:hypothetical protein
MRNQLQTILREIIRSPFLWLAITCALAYWPVSLHIFSLKNDALNYFLPVRYQISESIYHGYFPAWSPYFNLGYALLGDSQSGVWNPFVWLLSMTGPYTLYTLQFETLLYMYLAGCGMYVLCNYLKLHAHACWIAALSFMLCGFMSDSAQFLNWISGAAFLPWLVRYFLELLEEKSLTSGILTGIFAWLLLVTAYPAIFILSGYLLLALLIKQVFFSSIPSKLNEIKRLFPWLASALIVFVILSFPAIYHYAAYLPLSQRGDGASFEDAMSNPWHPSLLFTMLTPLGAFNHSVADITDPLERNSFFGLIGVWSLIAAGLSRFRTRWSRFFWGALILSFLFSLGQWAGIRSIAYYTLPLLDSFRHPAMAKIFTIFFAIIIGSSWLHEQFRSPSSSAVLSLKVLTVVFGLWAIMVFGSDRPFFLEMATSSWKSLKDGWSSWQWMQINVLIQLPFFVALWYAIQKKQSVRWFSSIALVNLMLHASCFCFFTVVKKDRANKIQSIINQHSPRGYPLPNQSSLAENSREGMTYFNEIGTLNMYNKQVGRVDYRISPCNLSSQIQFWDSSQIRNITQTYPLFYPAEKAILLSSVYSPIEDSLKEVSVFSSDARLVHSINQLSVRDQPRLNWQVFHPNQFICTVNQSGSRFWVLQQNHYPNWRLMIDGKPSKLEKVNWTMMGFEVPAGQHQIQLQFNIKQAQMGWIISLLFLMVCMATLWRIQK